MNNSKKNITLTYDLLEDIAMAMNEIGYENKWYLDMQDEAVVLVSDYMEDEELEENIENEYGDRYISVPVKESHERWEQMEKFIDSLDDLSESVRDSLYSAIVGKGAFGRFKSALYRLNIDKRWYEFKNLEDVKGAMTWLLSRELITDGDMEKGVQLYEKRQYERKRQEEGIANMNAGTTIRCIYNEGHTDKITPGKMYQVLDERKENLLVRIQDDRGKECWLPKSHFELVHLRKV